MKVCPRCELKYPDENDRCFVDGVALVPAPDPYIGTVIDGKYLVEQKIGEGGMATVYRARHRLVDKAVALKIMNPQLAGDARLRERFRREAKNAETLSHPNIVEIYGYGDTEDGTAFLVMELLDGEPLNHLIAHGAMPAAQVAAIGLQIARGLARAHDFDVIHRDLKPENVFVCRSQTGSPLVKLLDFGIARSMHDPRLTNKGEIFGTPQYMAPERVTSIDAGPEADLYALGVILFEMVTGRLPFTASDIPGYLLAHMSQAPPRPSSIVATCPRRLEELVLSLLAKKPEERPVDAHQVIRELLALVPEDAAGAAMLPIEPTHPGRVSAAPTLPPTTLEQWGRRASVFERMVSRAYPGARPRDIDALLVEIRGVIARIEALRAEGLKEQRALEAMDRDARDDRARLGSAVQTLAEDLSNARAATRAARSDVEPYLDADFEAEGAYRSAYRALEAGEGLRELPRPRPEVVSELRAMVDALDRWVVARDAADRARAWIESKMAELEDLEFQVKALRDQLERREADYEARRAHGEKLLRAHGDEMASLEEKLVELAGRLVAPLRTHPALGDLFRELEATT